MNNKKKLWGTILGVVAFIALVAGVTVNPINRGTDVLYKTEIAQKIQEISSKDESGLWIGNTNLAGQYLVANGVKTLNGVNSYPNFEWLNIVDPEGKFNEVYNRYAHIFINLGDETNFELEAPDVYRATLTSQNIKDLGVKYYFTNQKCDENTQQDFNMEEIYANLEKSQYIYQIK